MSKLVDYVNLIVESWYSAGHITLRDDNRQYMTVEIKAFLKIQRIKITLLAPNEYGHNGTVEVLIKHMNEDFN